MHEKEKISQGIKLDEDAAGVGLQPATAAAAQPVVPQTTLAPHTVVVAPQGPYVTPPLAQAPAGTLQIGRRQRKKPQGNP